MERLLAQKSRAAGLTLFVASAGTRALVGRDMEPGSREILQRLGADPEGFQATSIRAVDLQSFDLILTASEAHRIRVTESDPALLARTKTLLGFVDPDHDEILDPYGKTPSHYSTMEEQIVPAIDAVVSYLLRQSQ
jgi:protein-tyrosine phosphatase